MTPICHQVDVTAPPMGRTVRFFNFQMVVEKEPDEGYLAYCLSLSGCFGNGRTVEDAKRNRRDATTRPVAALVAHGEPVPQNERRAMSRNWPDAGARREHRYP